MPTSEKFGAFIRRHREAKEIGLREMARMVGVSAAFLSKVERDEFAPPAEENIKKIAEILDLDADALLARAGKVSSDLSEIIRSRPVELAALLRATKELDRERLEKVMKAAERVRKN
jgi:transcriptional regulator with XRE-family HTH domain